MKDFRTTLRSDPGVMRSHGTCSGAASDGRDNARLEHPERTLASYVFQVSIPPTEEQAGDGRRVELRRVRLEPVCM